MTNPFSLLAPYQFQTEISESKSVFQFQFKDSDCDLFKQFLTEKVITPQKEARLRLSQPKEDWMIFWKTHPSTEVKLMLAHPSENEWVATVALSKEAFDLLLNRLEKKLKFRLSELGSVSQFSNFDVEFQFL